MQYGILQTLTVLGTLSAATFVFHLQTSGASIILVNHRCQEQSDVRKCVAVHIALIFKMVWGFFFQLFQAGSLLTSYRTVRNCEYNAHYKAGAVRLLVDE